MSTRAQIAFYRSEHNPIDTVGTVYLFQHFDGAPAGVLPVLLPLARSFHQGREDIVSLTTRCSLVITPSFDTSEDETPCRGIPGARTTIHPDISYFYHVSPQRIIVYRVARDSNRRAFRLLHTVPLASAVVSEDLALPAEAA